LLVCGEPPWSGRTEQETLQMILSPERQVRYPKPRKPSWKCRDFMEGLLCDDMEERMSAAEALRHSWISGEQVVGTMVYTKHYAMELMEDSRFNRNGISAEQRILEYNNYTRNDDADYGLTEGDVQISNAGRFTMMSQLEESFDCDLESEDDCDSDCDHESVSSTETLSEVDMVGMLEIIDEVAGMSDDEFVERMSTQPVRRMPSFRSYISTDTSSVRTGISSCNSSYDSCMAEMESNRETETA